VLCAGVAGGKRGSDGVAPLRVKKETPAGPTLLETPG